jgi:hypothetical protein
MANIVIDVAAEFTGKRAFEQAGKSTLDLEKSVKKLAGAFGLAFSTQAVVNFAKTSVKAFVEDENAARSLSVTIKNLGLDFGNNTVLVGQFIDSIEKQTGVLDDELRPAMDRLLRSTGDVAKSQELLNLALDISAGTGKTVTQVSQSLQKAYLGQTAALGRLGVGLSKAELATGDFEDIQQKLTKLFAGQALSAADSYAGQLAKLQVAANNAKETIGKGLVDALKLLGKDTSINDLNEELEKTSLYVADIIRGVAVFTQKLKDIPVFGLAFQTSFESVLRVTKAIGGSVDNIAALGAEIRKLEGAGGGGFTDSQNAARLAAEKKAKADAKAAAAKLAADKKNAKNAAAAKIAADKKAAANKAILAKAESIFDLEKIQIEAALKGKISADEKLRLELQRAILNEDYELADKLQKRLEASQRATAALQGALKDIKPVPSPFDEWIDALKEIGETLSKILGINVNTSSSILNPNQPIVATQTPTVSPEVAAALADTATAAADMATAAANEAATIAADAADFASTLATGAAAAGAFATVTGAPGAAGYVAAITGNNPYAPLPYTGSSSSIFNPYGTSTNIAGWGTNTSTVQDTPAMPPIVVNIEGLIDMENVEGVFNMAMLNAIRKGLPQTIAGQIK